MNRIAAFAVVLALCAANSSFAEPSGGLYWTPRFETSRGTEEPLYCQTPGNIAVNAASGYGSEVADDLPAELAGQEFDTLTLWVAEWLAPWTDPNGITINVYDDTCPPSQVATQQFDVNWSDLQVQLFGQFGSMTVYEVVATLPSRISITESTSIGLFVENDWGAGAPFAGFFCSQVPAAEALGCSGLFWDNPTEGFSRWRSLNIGDDQVDLGFCLSLSGVSDAPDVRPNTRVLSARSQPNPFRALTNIVFESPSAGVARVGLFDAWGRKVRGLEQSLAGPGPTAVGWDGRDENGTRVPSGTYFYRVGVERAWIGEGSLIVLR